MRAFTAATRTILTTIVALLALSAADAAACPLDPAECAGAIAHPDELGRDIERLERGETIVSYREVENARGETSFVVAGSRIVDASRDEVWDVLTDFDTWPDFVPNLDEVEVEEIRPGRIVKVRERTSSAGRTFRFTSTRTIDARRGVLWDELDRSQPHDFESFSGFWQILALADGRTLVRMQTRLELPFYVPGFLRRKMLEASVPDSLGALADEVAARRSKGFDVAGLAR